MLYFPHPNWMTTSALRIILINYDKDDRLSEIVYWLLQKYILVIKKSFYQSHRKYTMKIVNEYANV